MPGPRLRRTAAIFGVLRNRELRALWFADWISDVGNFVTSIALVVYIFNLTGRATAVGLALALGSIPWFTVGPFAGLLADRVDRRSLMITANLIRAVLVGALPFTREVWQAYALSLASFMLAPVHRPARSAFLADIAPEGKLVPALAVMETTHQVLHTVGPAIGGLAVLTLGARHAFFLDSASFVIAAAFQATIASRGVPTVESAGSAVQDLWEGVRAVFAAGATRTYILLNSVLGLGFAGVEALLVVYVRDELGRPSGQYGIVLAMAGLGTVLTSLAIAAADEHRPRTPWVLASAAGVGTFAVAFLHPSFLALLPVALAAGLADAGVGIPMTATLAESLPERLRGRAYAAVDTMWELTAAIGFLGFAWLGEAGRLGAANGMGVAAVVGSALGAAVLLGGGARAIAGSERARLAPKPAGGSPAGLSG
ncbi:MAG: MFS transporter [Actinobacteria bacterium]|nr:MAG: MFS transporter [Actinomycetota bacterium]